MNDGGAFIHAEAGDIDKYIIIEKSIEDVLVKIKPDWELYAEKCGTRHLLLSNGTRNR